MSLHEEIAARFTGQDTKILLLAMADHIDTLERKVEQLERFLPHHLHAPAVRTPKEDDMDENSCAEEHPKDNQK